MVKKIAPGHLFIYPKYIAADCICGRRNVLLFGTPLTMAYNYPFGSDETDKTHFMIVGTRQRLNRINQDDRSKVSMDGHVLMESEGKKENLLGVTI